MNAEDFKELADKNTLPDGITLPLKALWLEKNGDWDAAHDLCNDIAGVDGYWIHAYLHRVEGDEWNAGYWYDRSGRKIPKDLSLEEEWESLVSHFL